jgi:hypothetical protein
MTWRVQARIERLQQAVRPKGRLFILKDDQFGDIEARLPIAKPRIASRRVTCS